MLCYAGYGKKIRNFPRPSVLLISCSSCRSACENQSYENVLARMRMGLFSSPRGRSLAFCTFCLMDVSGSSALLNTGLGLRITQLRL